MKKKWKNEKTKKSIERWRKRRIYRISHFIIKITRKPPGSLRRTWWDTNNIFPEKILFYGKPQLVCRARPESLWTSSNTFHHRPKTTTGAPVGIRISPYLFNNVAGAKFFILFPRHYRFREIRLWINYNGIIIITLKKKKNYSIGAKVRVLDEFASSTTYTREFLKVINFFRLISSSSTDKIDIVFSASYLWSGSITYECESKKKNWLFSPSRCRNGTTFVESDRLNASTKIPEFRTSTAEFEMYTLYYARTQRNI